MKGSILAALLCLTALGVIGQNTIGLPDIINYTKQAYRGGAQNRQIRQDRNGVIYFANNEGVLTFDGVYWKTYRLPNNSIVRTLDFGPDNKLYVGGQDEFGFFAADKNGSLKYHSLRHLVPEEERSFTDVWEVFFYKGSTFFQTSNKIFEIKGNHCTVYKSDHWRFIGLSNGRLIAQDHTRGLLQFIDGRWVPFITKSGFPPDYFVSAAVSIGRDSTLITTAKHGVFLLCDTEVSPLQSPFLSALASKLISGAALIDDKYIALTTNLAGCYIIDFGGNLVQSFSRKEGLQNNNVLDIFPDREGNLWLGLDNGIDFIAYNNAIKHIYPDNQNEGSGYAALIYNNSLYLGTSNGLYRVPLYPSKDLSYVKGEFEPVANSHGQVWNLSEVNGQLLMGHHDGAFLVTGNKAIPFDNSSGFWGFLPFQNVLPAATVVAGTYQGINFYQHQDGRLLNKNVHAHFESARYVLTDNDVIWTSHPYKGIYRIKANTTGAWQVKQYGKREGITAVNNNYIFRIGGRVLVASESGIFVYENDRDAFVPSPLYDPLFKGKSIRYLKEDPSGNIWFVHDKLLGVVLDPGGKKEVIYLSELTNKFVSGFEYLYPLDKNNIFIGGERGFYHINFEQYKKNIRPLQVHLRNITIRNGKDSLLFGGYFGEANQPSNPGAKPHAIINPDIHSYIFEFAAPAYSQQANIEYSYYLEGFDSKWSEYANKTEKEYTRLPPGSYVFHVKARTNLGNESKVSSFRFTVLPPWYRSSWAYFAYTVLFFAVLYRLYQLQQQQYRKKLQHLREERERLQYLHQLELEKNEKEIIQLRNEKLEAEINHKNKELASTAMHLVQKGELLSKVKGELQRAQKGVRAETAPEDYKRISKILKEETKIDDDWEHFTMHFDKVHSDFLVMLKERYPKLTPNELKLCAYLRMNLSSKEIAQLLNITVRGVEISRYRLRKKLQIPTETNLFEYLINLQIQH